MLTARFQIAGRVLLAASVLLTGSVTPGISHAHEEGGRPHQHRATRTHSHGHSHGHAHSSGSHQHPRSLATNNTVGRCTNCTCHMHISWLGVDLTFPAESGDNESGIERSGLHEVIVVQPFDASVAAAPTDWCFDSAFLALFAQEATDCSVSATARPHFSSLPNVTGSLCDTARHERSGVQLA